MLRYVQSLALQLDGDKGLPADAGKAEGPPANVDSIMETLESLIANDILARLVGKLGLLSLEARNALLNLFSVLLRPGMALSWRTTFQTHLRNHTRIFGMLVEGYSHEQEEIALFCGSVIRSCTRHRELAMTLFKRSVAFELLDLAQYASFEVSTDAFCSLRRLLLAHREVAVEWIKENFMEFFSRYDGILQCGEYVKLRQATRLLHDALLSVAFARVMMAYVNEEQHLRIVMNILKSESRQLRVEAFHIFKLFVINPRQTPRIEQILRNNRDGLCHVLDGLCTSQSEDKDFVRDQHRVIRTLQALQPKEKEMKEPIKDHIKGANHWPSSDSILSVSTTCSS